MKKIILCGIAIAITFAGCKKKSEDEPVPTTPAIGAVPATFGTKVMVEENTGAWCGWCVLGAEAIKTAEDANPGRINAVALHGGGGGSEPMTQPEYSAMVSFASISGVPHYRMNRGTGGGFPGSFNSNVNSKLAQVSSCGLAIDARESSGSSISFTVHAGFNAALTGDYRLITYLVEDGVTGNNAAGTHTSGYNQQNYVSGDNSYPNSYYFSQPAIITNYSHQHVERKLLSATLAGGDSIPAASVGVGKEFVKTYTYALPAANLYNGTTNPNGWKPENMSVVVGILKYSPTCANQVILNSQTCKLGALKNWD